MGVITAIQPQKRSADRVNIHLDGQFAFGLSLAVAANLRVGQELSETDIARIQAHETIEKARLSAVRFISYRPRSVLEVRHNLRRKAYEAEVIDAVVDRLLAADLLDDEAFARYWVEQRETFKPRSRLALRQELAAKGIDRRIVDSLLDEVDEPEAAYRAAQRRAERWANLPPDQFRLKLGRFLQGRGFAYGVIREVTDRLQAELGPAEREAE